MSRTVSRTMAWKSTYPSVVISPSTSTRPVVVAVSQATRGVAHFCSAASLMDGVEDGVRDLVAHLVGMAFGDRLRGEEVLLGVG